MRGGQFSVGTPFVLAARAPAKHKRRVPTLFDMRLRSLRRDRAARVGTELFLYERVFEDCVERLALMKRQFRKALLIGCPDPGWPDRLRAIIHSVEVADPGPLFAAAAGGTTIVEDAWEPRAHSYDLVLSIGTLDTVNDLPLAFRLAGSALVADGLFMGALSGSETLPQLRSAMRAADAIVGVAAPHVHPRIEASALAPLLAEAGFQRPVVDLERVPVAYPSLRRLVSDLRAMGATNILSARPPSLARAQYDEAARAFAAAGEVGRTKEMFEILHFAAWTPKRG